MPDQWDIEWKDYYAILQISVTAEEEVINAAYKTLAKKYHPDGRRGGDLEKMQSINLCYDTLSDQTARNRYDNIYRRRADRANTELQKIVSQLRQEKIERSNLEKAERATLERKINDLEKEIIRVKKNEQEVHYRLNETLSLNRQLINSSQAPPVLAQSIPVVSAGSWRLPISIQTAFGLIHPVALSLNANQSVSGFQNSATGIAHGRNRDVL